MTARQFLPRCVAGASVLFVASEVLSWLSALKIPERYKDEYEDQNVPEDEYGNLHRCRVRNLLGITGLVIAVFWLSCRNFAALGYQVGKQTATAPLTGRIIVWLQDLALSTKNIVAKFGVQ